MNLYSNLVAIKDSLGISGTGDDDILLLRLEASSRIIDNETGRHFYVKSETRYFDGEVPLRMGDLLSIDTSGLTTDDDGDATFENTFATTDYILYPMNIYPKTKIELSVDSDYRSFGNRVRGCSIAGVWGYGDGVSAMPYSSSGDATTDNLSDVATSIGVTDADSFSPGQTVLLSAEQCYVSGYDTSANTITLVRGINGTNGIREADALEVIISNGGTKIEYISGIDGKERSFYLSGSKIMYDPDTSTAGDEFSIAEKVKTIPPGLIFVPTDSGVAINLGMQDMVRDRAINVDLQTEVRCRN